MIGIGGILLTEIPFKDLTKVGVLMYNEYPSTVIYADKSGLPIILEWVDCNDEGDVDRYLLFKSTKSLLKKFLQAEISHLHFIKKSIIEYATCFDGNLSEPISARFVRFEEIPIDYLPKESAFFLKADSVELNHILIHFSLSLEQELSVAHINKTEINDVVLLKPEYGIENITDQLELTRLIATDNSTPVFNIHLQEGESVKYGSVETSVFGHLITSFNDLYKETALDVLKGTNRGKIISFNSKKGKQLLPKVSTEIFIQRAASFSIFIRPLMEGRQLTISEDADNDAISDNLFLLFFSNKDKEALEAALVNFSSFAQKSYIDFLTVIKENNVGIDYNFYSPFSKNEYVRHFNPANAWEVLDLINGLSNKQSDTFSIAGKFKALNCNTGHYTVESNDKQSYWGHFDILLKDNMPNLNFTDIYSISVQRTSTKITGRADYKIEDIIVSCYKE